MTKTNKVLAVITIISLIVASFSVGYAVTTDKKYQYVREYILQSDKVKVEVKEFIKNF